MGTKRLLLIAEDEPVMRQAIKGTLSTLEDYTVVEACDGLEAQEIIDECNPAIIVLDLLMPKMGGIDVLISLQERPGPRPDGKIIVLSALVTPHMVEHLQHLGAHRVVTKPFHIDDLLKAVEEVAQSPADIHLTNSSSPAATPRASRRIDRSEKAVSQI